VHARVNVAAVAHTGHPYLPVALRKKRSPRAAPTNFFPIQPSSRKASPSSVRATTPRRGAVFTRYGRGSMAAAA